MFRVLYIFVIIHILRGCPKTIPFTVYESSESNYRTPNDTSVCISQKPHHFPVKLYEGLDVSFFGKISSDTRYTHTMYTGLLPAGITNFLQSSYYARILNIKTDVAKFLSEHWPHILLGVYIGAIFMIPLAIFMRVVAEKYSQIERRLTSAENTIKNFTTGPWQTERMRLQNTKGVGRAFSINASALHLQLLEA
ncbi:hypothetical protein AAHC03_04493 [Spirometra sp. Aus1]